MCSLWQTPLLKNMGNRLRICLYKCLHENVKEYQSSHPYCHQTVQLYMQFSSLENSCIFCPFNQEREDLKNSVRFTKRLESKFDNETEFLSFR